MRFRLAALGDCPDFILGEVHALSQLHVGQARALTEEAARVMTGTRAQVDVGDTHGVMAVSCHDFVVSCHGRP